MRTVVLGISIGLGAGCAARPQATTSQASAPSEIDADCMRSAGARTSAGDGWNNDFIPQLYDVGYREQVSFGVDPAEPSAAPIDAVIGLANGPAGRFT